MVVYLFEISLFILRFPWLELMFMSQSTIFQSWQLGHFQGLSYSLTVLNLVNYAMRTMIMLKGTTQCHNVI